MIWFCISGEDRHDTWLPVEYFSQSVDQMTRIGTSSKKLLEFSYYSLPLDEKELGQ
jgi:hypothetical protein